MTLSITQRLVITVALLSAVVLAFSGWAFHLALTRGMGATALERGISNALEVDHGIWVQLDEDILADFAGERIEFDKLNVPFNDWAVVRGNGALEAVHGMFQDMTLIGVGKPAEIVSLKKDRVYAVASVHLIRKKLLMWLDLPVETRKTIRIQVPDGTFLWAKSDVIDNRNVYAVQMLCPDHIMDLSVTEEGELIGAVVDELAGTLPAGMPVLDDQGRGLQNPVIVNWQALGGELLATVQGQDPDGGMVRVAVNRLGEQYEVAPDGAVGQKQENYRLWVVAASDVSLQMARTRALCRGVYLTMSFIWMLMVLIAWQVTKRALKPVHEIVQQAEKIMPSGLNERLPYRPVNDELSHLAKTVNRMLDRIQAGYQREQQFTGDASHEMRNPLAKMTAEIDLALSKDRNAPAYKDTLARLRTYAQGMQNLTDSLLILARLDAGLQEMDIRPFDVSELVVDVLKTFPKEMASRVQLDLGPSVNPMMAIAHKSLMGVLIGNLLDNALRYGSPDSPVFLRIHRRAKTIHFSIEDQGPGIPKDQRDLVFNRFHRLEEARSKTTGGVGLGLAIVQAIAEVHHIKIDIEAGLNRGTVMSFSLPAQHDQGT